MRKLKYLLRHINLLNILLALLLILLANYTAFPFLRMNAAYTLPPVKKPAIEKVAADEKTGEEKSPSPTDYLVIADQNLFHPDRIIPVPKVAGPPTALPEPEFVLYGTLMTDGLKIAYMEDKKAETKEKKDGRKKQTALRLGETMSGFILVEVHDDRVVMKRAGDKDIVVSLTEPKVRETPVAAAAAPAAAQGAAAAPGKATVSSRSRTRIGATGSREERKEKTRELREKIKSEQSRGRSTFFGGRRLGGD